MNVRIPLAGWNMLGFKIRLPIVDYQCVEDTPAELATFFRRLQVDVDRNGGRGDPFVEYEPLASQRWFLQERVRNSQHRPIQVGPLGGGGEVELDSNSAF